MSPVAKSALTLVTLVVLLVGGTVWGYQALTEELPKVNDPPPCSDWTAKAGSKLYPDQVTVSVYNAGSRGGLAGRTLQALGDQGFAEGEQDNVSSDEKVKVKSAQIWASAPDDPAAKLVASYLGKGVEIVERDSDVPGILVLVGDDFGGVVEGRKKVKVAEDTVVCSPRDTQEETEDLS